MTREKAVEKVESLIYKLADWAGVDICELEEAYEINLDNIFNILRGEQDNEQTNN